jgi:uncharacterized membrane protein (UPF0127 family)
MFLEKGRPLSSKAGALRKASGGRQVAGTVELAVTSETRRRGQRGRDGLAPGHALLIAPCSSIHTWFMRFPIDVIYVRRDGLVLKTRAAIPAWRMSVGWGAFAVVEMAAGAAAQAGVSAGDRLELVFDS